MPESKLTKTEWGLLPTDKGWFVVNVRDARWAGGGGYGRHAERGRDLIERDRRLGYGPATNG